MSDATPTRMRWHLEGPWLIGYETPALSEHADRTAGRMILDNGEWREVQMVGVELPTDVEKALTIQACLKMAVRA